MMDELLQSANDALSAFIHFIGGYFDYAMSALREDPYVTGIVAAVALGAWLFHRRDPSAP